MRKSTLLGLVCLLTFGLVGAQSLNRAGSLTLQAAPAQVTTSLRAPVTGFGFANRNETEPIGVGIPNAHLIALIELPYTPGNVIKGVNFHANAVPVSDGKIYISEVDTEGATLIVAQEATIAKGWNSVALSTPFTMQEGKLYLVGWGGKAAASQPDQFMLSYDQPINGKMRPACWVIANGNLPELNKKYLYPKFLQNLSEQDLTAGNALVFVDIEDSAVPMSSVVFPLSASIKEGTVVDPASNATLELSVMNLSAEAVTSLQVEYTIAGGQKQTADINSVNIAAESAGTVQFSVAMPNSGTGSIELKTVTVNGKKNLYAANALSVGYYIKGENSPINHKTLLIEHFTTERCPQCPRSEAPLEAFKEYAAEQGVEVSYLAHHAAYYTDDYTLKEDEQLVPLLYAGEDGSFAPGVLLDRRPISTTRTGAPFLVAAGTSQNWSPWLGKAMSFDDGIQYVDITELFAATEQVAEGTKITLTMEGNILGPVDVSKLYFTAVLTEDGIISKRQAGATGEFTHNGLARHYFTAGLGDKLTPDAETGHFSATKEYTISNSETWNKDKLKVVAFVHYEAADADVNKKYVHDSGTVRLGEHLGVANAPAEEAPVVFVQDGYLNVLGAINTIQVYDMQGSLVADNAPVRLASGMYIVRIQNAGGTFTSKVLVK